MTSRQHLWPLAACAWFAACAGGPTPGPGAGPTTSPPRAEAPTSLRPTPSAAPAPRQIVRLENGMTAVVTTVAAGRTAVLQFGISVGAAFLAPGAAELAAQVLVDGADPSQGRPSLRQTIAGMGGTLQTHIGPLTSWIDMRVPGNRWREALVALRDALQSPSWSRNQIERIREQLVAARTAALRADPAVGMARLLLLGESSGASYVLGLLDRDPAEITTFLARTYQPERMVLAAEVPGDPAVAAAELGRTGSIALAAWTPPPSPGPVPLLDRKFESGIHWSPAREEADRALPCRVAVVTMLPPAGPLAADELLLLACFSLDGAGGRLERLQQERGLGHVRWRGSTVQTPDAAAVVLTAEVQPGEVAELWRTVERARNSLRDLPPNDSELAIATARVPLTARLATMDDSARVRAATMLALTGGDPAAVDHRLAMLRGRAAVDLRGATTAFLARPFAMVVVGGDVPADVPGVRRFDVLPVGYDAGATSRTAPQVPPPAAKPQPWLAGACDAVGGTGLLRRLRGWQSTAEVVHEQAPPMEETITWSDDGSLQRCRTLLGQKIETTLAEAAWSERSGATVRSLDAREAAVLRREMQRHPLALLAAHARGELSFRTIAQRDAGDRTVVVLEALGDRFDRLRLHLDTQSFLVRVVETWETLADGTVVHVSDAWQDYRTGNGLRAPHRRLTTQNDGQNRVETVFRSWLPTLRSD